MEELSLIINERIKTSSVYKNYKYFKSVVAENEELSDLRSKMQELKNVICKNRNQNLVDEYYLLEKQYKNNSLIKQYEECKKDLEDLLKEMVDILSLN